MYRMKPNGLDLTAEALATNSLWTGWSEIPHASQASSQQELRDEIRATYDRTTRSAAAQAHSFWLFLREMEPGDYVVTPAQGTVHIGRVLGEPRFHPDGVQSDSAWRRPVVWTVLDLPRSALSAPLRKKLYNPNTAADLSDCVQEIETISRSA